MAIYQNSTSELSLFYLLPFSIIILCSIYFCENSTYLNPRLLYTSDALGKLSILENNKL